MHVVLGATGHVGGAVIDALRDAGEAVIAVTHDGTKADSLRRDGVEVAVADVSDPAALHAIFRRADRAFLLNPPADPATDTDAAEHRTLRSIVDALDGSGLAHVVLQSTFGVRPGKAIGDLSVLWDFEQALAGQPIPHAIVRAAYYMTNWNAMLEPARGGTLPSMLPAALEIPMVAPADLGAVAARLLRGPPVRGAIHHVEGPARYTADDVAAAFGQALGREVRVAVTPPDELESAYRGLGFSEPAAAYARMTRATLSGDFEPRDRTEHGRVTLDTYVAALVRGG